MDRAQLKWLLCACILAGCTDGKTEVVLPSGQGGATPAIQNACGASNPCKADEICTSNGCSKAAGIGSFCGDGFACSQGVCESNICKVVVMPGQACGTGKSCSESDCVNGVCLKKVLEGGDCRSSLTYCENGTCLNGFCKDSGFTPGTDTNCLDSDNDTIGDDWDSCDMDTDSDTLPDCLDLDSDGDNIPDSLETLRGKCQRPTDSDDDGIFNFLSLDSDGNGIADADEGAYLEDQVGRKYRIVVVNNTISVEDMDGNAVGSGIDPVTHQLLDTTGQPVDNLILRYADLDKDGIPDFMDTDNDGDAVSDYTEITGVVHKKYRNLGADAPRAADCDGDTLPDNPGTATHPFDCDSDDVPDYMSNDSDGDGIEDSIEDLTDTSGNGFLDRYSQDSDNDGITDVIERGRAEDYVAITNDVLDFRNPDIDGDGLEDGLEVVCVYDLTCEDASLTACTSKCTDLQTDAANCGSCGVVCEHGQQCVGGACTAACDELGLTECSNVCVDVSSDPKFCGNCSTACAENEKCISGVCTQVYFTCMRKSDTSCYGACVDLKNDDRNCSSCGNKCAGGTICVNGSCVDDGSNKPGKNVVDGRFVVDSDGDGYNDASEYVAAIAVGKDPSYFICDRTKGVKADAAHGTTEGAFEFYFELPYEGDEKDDMLNFKPKVSMLDVVFNLDTTNSMGGEVNNLKDNIKNKIYPDIKKNVKDSAFGVSRFDDFPTRGTPNSDYDYLPGYGIKYGYGRASEHDVPYELLGRTETDESTVITNVNKLGLHNGGDLPESGYESLWQLVMGDDKTKPQAHWYAYGNGAYAEFSDGSLAYATHDDTRWGGASFRNSSLPVVIHITDTISHDEKDSPYDPVYIENAHYSSAVHQAYVNKGARIISIFRKDKEHASELDKKVTGRRLNQLIETSQATNAVVPVCAFKKDASSWMCGADKCCTEMDASGNPVAVNPADGRCVLSFGIDNSSSLSTSLVAGVDALVKYATSQVAAVVRGEPIEGSDIDTSCFIKRVEAFDVIDEWKGYNAPPQEPETSCNPVAVPAQFNGSLYNNGYKNFATGTSSSDKPGAELNFRVVAQNDSCVKPKEQAQVFTAHIDIIDPITGVNYGSRDVSIIVPGEKAGAVN